MTVNAPAWTCPNCGCTEYLGERCGCGLLWTQERRSMPHYALLLAMHDVEKLRFRLSREMTASYLARDRRDG